MPKPRMIFAPGVKFKVVAQHPDLQDQIGVIIRVPNPKVFVARIAPRPWTWVDDAGALCMEERPEIEVVFGTCESEFMLIEEVNENVSP